MENNKDKRPHGELLVYQGQGLSDPVQIRLEGETVWLSQKLMAELYGVSTPTVNEHISNIYDDEELLPEATIRKFRIVQMEGSREVGRLIDHYNLEMIIAVGFRVRSRRGSQFRKWANERISEYLVKGFTMDDERLKGNTGLVDYFDEWFMEPQMDMAHRFLIEPRNTQNNTEGGLFDFLCLPYVPWLKIYSAFISHISTLAAGGVSVFSEKWKLKPEKRLKEIQR